jgi:hypothetical protein
LIPHDLSSDVLLFPEKEAKSVGLLRRKLNLSGSVALLHKFSAQTFSGVEERDWALGQYRLMNQLYGLVAQTFREAEPGGFGGMPVGQTKLGSTSC